MSDTVTPENGRNTVINKTKRTVKEHPWAAFAAVLGIVSLVIDRLVAHEITTAGVMGAFLGAVIFVADVSNKAEKEAERNAEQAREIALRVEALGALVQDNTSVLRAHEQLLPSRTVDRLNLIAFNNLLAYLPFYLAQDLGYLKEEHIELSREIPSLDDRSTIKLLHENYSDSIAICDPYLCLSEQPMIRMIYPLCCGVAAWPMTLNWIGTAPPFPTVEGVTSAPASNKVLIASYQKPSTTYALAQLVAQRIVKPLLKDGTISPEVVSLEERKPHFGENDSREIIEQDLKDLLIGHNVVMLWEPHCQMALQLGARYLSPSAYEASLRDYGESITYSALVMSETLIKTNPTLPIRLRRALDRAVVRLQDPDRLAYCRSTLEQRRLLTGLDDELRKDVLAKIVQNIPKPCDTQEIRATNWSHATRKWADGLFAADKLRQSLVRGDQNLAPGDLGLHMQHYSNAGDYRPLIYGGSDTEN